MNSRFDLLPTPLPGLHVLRRKPIEDSRGYLERMFCIDELHTLVSARQIAQINHTLTARRGTVRGMHFQQPPYAEAKFVSCLRGEVFDVAVDVRAGSPTFLHWHGELLSADNHKTLFIPEGFAHGFQALCDDCEMLYAHTSVHEPTSGRGLHAEDPRVGVCWPLPVCGLSQRDAALSYVSSDFSGVAP